MSKIVVALGGNAILQRDQQGTIEEQAQNVEAACRQLAGLIMQGHRLVVTHGNGPQVGNILLQNEEAYKAAAIPPMPLDVCGAESQGFIGYLIQRSLRNELRRISCDAEVVTLVTQVLVDKSDQAFKDPQKPIGPFYTEARAKRLTAQRGYVMKEDALRGYRRVVPSPEPKAIVEKEIIKSLFDAGKVVISAGGGGIPVFQDESGQIIGVEAVIDKDLAAERLATDLGADTLLVLTDVERVAIHYGRHSQQFIDRASPAQMREWQSQGHFKPGSMGPKVEAAVRFVENGGKAAIITSLALAQKSLEGSGTHISTTA